MDRPPFPVYSPRQSLLQLAVSIGRRSERKVSFRPLTPPLAARILYSQGIAILSLHNLRERSPAALLCSRLASLISSVPHLGRVPQSL